MKLFILGLALAVLVALGVKPLYLNAATVPLVTMPPRPLTIPSPPPSLTVKLAAPATYNICSCVSYAKWYSHINVGSIGLALHHPINTQTASVGAIVVMRISSAYYKNTGHLAVVTAVTATSFTVTEANFKHCQISSRVVVLGDSSIVGFYVATP